MGHGPGKQRAASLDAHPGSQKVYQVPVAPLLLGPYP